MTQVTYPNLADPADPSSSKIFRIISITKYFEKYFKSTLEIFRNYFRNISKVKYFERVLLFAPWFLLFAPWILCNIRLLTNLFYSHHGIVTQTFGKILTCTPTCC